MTSLRPYQQYQRIILVWIRITAGIEKSIYNIMVDGFESLAIPLFIQVGVILSLCDAQVTYPG